MSEAAGMTSTDFRLGFHKPFGHPWQPVIYTVVKIGEVDYAVLQGCILLGTVEEQEALVKRIRDNGNPGEYFTDPGAVTLGGAIKGASYRWKNGRVPYEISAAMPRKERITDAIAHWQNTTKVRFEPRKPTDADWVEFVVGPGCASYVGRRGGRQEIVIGDACSVGNVKHEIGHCIGLYHEQSRSDRDGFVEIKWANVKPESRHNFQQEDSDNLSAYDYGSIMHYPRNAFSVNGQDTIVLRGNVPPGVVVGQREALSAADIATVAKLYP